MDNCHLEHFTSISVRGQNATDGVVEKVDITSVQNVLIMSNFHRL